jgi:hypothetical protein
MGRPLHAMCRRSIGDERANNFHDVHRNLKHISVVPCISAAGEHITPFFVSSQVNSKAESRLKSEEFRPDVNFILKH